MAYKASKSAKILVHAVLAAVAVLLIPYSVNAQAISSQTTSSTPSKSVQRDLTLASMLWEKHKPKECIDVATSVIQADPNCNQAYLFRGQANYQMERFHAAIADLDTYFNRTNSKGDIPARRMRGLSLSNCGNFKAALKDFDYCVKAQPGIWDFWQDRAKDYAELGQFDKAISDATQMIKLKPDHYRYALRARVYYMAGRYKQSIDDWSKAISLGADRSGYYASRAQCYDKLGQKDLADADRKKRDSVTLMW